MQQELYPCEEHNRELLEIRALLKVTGEELAIMQELFKRLEKSLFGNGQPGVLDKLTTRVNLHDKIIYIGLGIIAAMQFLSGSGVISLKNLLGK